VGRVFTPRRSLATHEGPPYDRRKNFCLSVSGNFSIAYRIMVRGIRVWRVDRNLRSAAGFLFPASLNIQPTAL
jgi:hypothetical protein